MTKKSAAKKMSYWPTYSLLGVLLVMGGLLGYYLYQYDEKPPRRSPEEGLLVALGIKADDQASTTNQTETTLSWHSLYPNTKPMTIGKIMVNASVATSWPERIMGLSGTPYLPEEVVKLFIYDSPGLHPIWMKDMNYPIDILWVDENNRIVTIEKAAQPESYPADFSPTLPAKYVIETAAGFAEKNELKIGDSVTLPE